MNEATSLGSGSDRTFTIKITSDNTFNATIGNQNFYNLSFNGGAATIDSFALWSTVGPSGGGANPWKTDNPDSYWKNASVVDTGSVELGYALGGSGTFNPGIIANGLSATSTTAVATNAIIIGGDAGSVVILDDSNTYGGATTVNNNATVRAANANAFGTNGTVTVSSGGALQLSNNINVARAITLNGTGVSSSGGALRNMSGANTNSGAITLGSNSRINTDSGSLTLSGGISGGANVLFVGGASNTTISSAISGGGASQDGTTTSLFKDGASTLTLSGNNTYTGDTRIVAGAITVAAGGSLGSGSDVFISSGASLTVNTNTTVASIQETGTGNAGTASIADGATLTINGNSYTNYMNSISGAGSLTKSGSGYMNLYGSPSYTGTTTVSGGTLATGTNMASTNFVVNGGAFATGAGNQLVDSAAISLSSGTFTIGGNDTVGSFTMTGGTLGGSSTLTASTYTLNGGTVTGNIGAGTATASSGTTSLNGTLGANLTVNGGTLNLGSAGRLSSSSSLKIDSGQLTLGGNEAVTGFSGSGGTLALGTNTLTVTNSGDTNYGGTITGTTGGLTKAGAGILTLTGTNTHSGTTLIQAGTVRFNGSNATAVTVANNGKIGGSGTVGAVTVQGGGRLAPGNSPGNLTVSSLTLEAGSGYDWEVENVAGTAGTEWDLITVGGGTGTVTINANNTSGKHTVYISGTGTGFSNTGTYSWKIIDAGTLSNFAADKFAVSYSTLNGVASPTGTWSFTNSSGDLLLNYAAAAAAYDITVASGSENQAQTYTGDNALNKLGAGTLVLNDSANSYTGTTTIRAGTLQITVAAPNGANGALGNSVGAVVVGNSTAAEAATFDIGAAVENARALTLQAGTGTANRTLSTSVGSGTATQSGAVAVNSDAIFSAASGGTLLVSGALTGSSGVTVSNSGVVVLTGNSTNFSGGLTVNSGSTLRAGHGSALGSTNGSTTVSSGGTLALSNNITTAENLTITGTGVGSAGALQSVSGSNTNTGTVTLGGDATIGAGSGASLVLGNVNAAATNNKLYFAGAGNITLTGNLSGMSDLSTFYKNGNGELIISNTSANTGGAQLQLGAGKVTLAAGTFSTNSGTSRRALDLGIDGTDGTSTSDAAFYVNGGVTMSNSIYVAPAGAGGLGTRTLGTESTSDTATFNNEIYLGGDLTVSAATGGTALFSGSITNSGNLTKLGAGTVTLSGANTFGGNVAVGAGTLSLSGGSALHNTNAVTISNGATLNLANSEAVGSIAGAGSITLNANTLTAGQNNSSTTHSGVISGSGNILKEGTGILTLSGGNTFTGATDVNAGTLQLSGTGTLSPSSRVNVGAGATFDISALSGAGTSVKIISEQGNSDGGSIQLGAKTLTLDGGAANTTYYFNFLGISGDTGGFTLNGTSTATLSLYGSSLYTGTTTVTSGTLTTSATMASTAITVGGGTFTASANNLLSDTASVTVNSGAFNANGTDTVGSVTITGGTLGGSGTLTASTYALQGGTVNAALGAGAITVSSGTTTLGSAGRLHGSATLTINSGQLSLGGNESVAAFSGGGGTLALGSGTLTTTSTTDTTFSGVITGTGGLTKAGSGKLTLSGSNAFSGAANLLGGTLEITNANSLGRGQVGLGSGGTLATLLVSSNATITNTFQVNNAATNAVINVASGTTTTLSGKLTQDGAKVNTTKFGKDGAGTLILNNGTSDYNGQLQVGQGTVILGATAALGTNTSTSVRGIDLGLNVGDTSTPNNVSLLASNGVTVGQSIYVSSNTNSATRTIGISGNGTNSYSNEFYLDGNLTVDAGTLATDRVNMSGAILNTGGLIKTGSGNLVLSGSNTYSGTTTLNAGTLTLSGADNRIATGNTLTFGGSSTLNLGGYSQTLAQLTTSLGLASTLTATNGSLTINGNAAFRAGETNNGSRWNFAGLNSFVYNRTNQSFTIQVATIPTNSGVTNTFNFAATGIGSNSISAFTIQIGGASGSSQGTNFMTVVTLGKTNIFNATNVTIGGFNGAGTVSFDSSVTNSSPTLKIRSLDGTSRSSILLVGATSSGDSGRLGNGTLDLTGGNLDIVVTNFIVGQQAANAATAVTGIVTMGGGSVDATSLILADRTALTNTPNLTATFNQLGGSVKAATMLFGRNSTNTNAVFLPTYNLAGGTLFVSNVSTSTTNFGTSSVRNLVINGGTLRNYDTNTSATISGESTTASGRLNIMLSNNANNTIWVDAARTMTISNTAVMGGAGGFIKDGAGTLSLAAANTNTGAIIITNGIISTTGAGVLGSSSAVSVASGATLQLGGNQTVGSIAGAGTINFGTNSMTFGGDNSTTSYTGAFTGTGTLIKAGTGTNTLTGTGITSGTVQVNAGGLTLNPGAGNTLNLGTRFQVLPSSGTATATFSSGTINLSTDGGISGLGDGTGGTANFNVSGATVNVKLGTNRFLIGNKQAGVVTVSSGALNFTNTNNLYIGGDTQYATTNAANGTLTINGGSVDISGTGSLVLGVSTNAVGTINLNGGTFTTSRNITLGTNGTGMTGTVNFNGGTMVITANSASFMTGLTAAYVKSGGAIIDTANTNTIGQALLTDAVSTGGGLTKLGAGKLTLTGANTYTGATTISNGVLNIQNATATGTTAGGIAVRNGAALEMQGGITVGAEALTMDGAGITSGGALRNISGNNNYQGSITLNSASRINSDSGTLTLSGAIEGNNQNLTVGGDGTTTISGAIGTANGSLSKDGAGTLNLSGTNSFTGATTVTAGTLALLANNVIHDSSAVTINGGTLAVGTRGETLHSVTMTSGTLSKGSNSNGDLTLANASSFTGGTVLLSSTSSKITANGSLTLGGVTFDYSSTGTSPNTSALVLGGNVSTTGNSTTVFTNSSTGSSLPFVNLNNGTRTFDVISGTALDLRWGVTNGGIVKTGAGTMTLSASNAHAGGTTINQGVLAFSNSGGLGSGTVTVNSNAILRATANLTNSRNITITTGNTGFVEAAAGTTNTLNGTLSKDGSVLVLGGGGTHIVNGSITGASANSDLYVSNSTTTINSTNSYNGPTFIVAAGTLNNGTNNALPTDTALTLGQDGETSSTTNTYNLNGYSQTVASVATAGASVNVVTNSTGTGNLTLNSSSAKSISNLRVGGSGLTLTKSGTNTVTLASGNTVAPGTIAIQQGTLLLGAANQIGNNTAINLAGGTLDTGGFADAAGQLAITANSSINGLNAAGDFVFSSIDLSTYSGEGSQSTLTLLGNYARGGVIRIATTDYLGWNGYSESTMNTFLSKVQFGDPALQAGSISFGGGFATLSVIPEPKVYVAAGVLVLLIGYTEYRRRRKTGSTKI